MTKRDYANIYLNHFGNIFFNMALISAIASLFALGYILIVLFKMIYFLFLVFLIIVSFGLVFSIDPNYMDNFSLSSEALEAYFNFFVTNAPLFIGLTVGLSAIALTFFLLSKNRKHTKTKIGICIALIAITVFVFVSVLLGGVE